MLVERFNFAENDRGLFYIIAMVPVGAADETDKIQGVSHLLEHVVLTQTANYRNNKLSNALTQVGASYNALTDSEHTIYHIKAPGDEVETCIRVLHDVLSNPCLSDEDIRREKEVVVQEHRLRRDQDDSAYYERVTRLLLGAKNPYSRPVSASRATIDHIPASRVRAFYKKHYNADNIVYFVNCPRGSRRRAAALMSRVMGTQRRLDWTSKYRRVEAYETFNARRYVVSDDNLSQTTVSLAFKTFPAADAANITVVDFATFVLCRSDLSSLLLRKLRTELGLVYSVSCEHRVMRHLGHVVISASSSVAGAAKAIVDESLRVLVDFALTREQFAKFHRAYVNRLKLDETQVEGSTWHAAMSAFWGVPKRWRDRVAMAAAITEDRVRDVSRMCLRRDNIAVVVRRNAPSSDHGVRAKNV